MFQAAPLKPRTHPCGFTREQTSRRSGGRTHAEALSCADLGLLGLGVPVTRRGLGFEQGQELATRHEDLLDRCVENSFVGLRWGVETRELAYELQGCGANFLVRRRRVEIEQGLDVSAHGWASVAPRIAPWTRVERARSRCEATWPVRRRPWAAGHAGTSGLAGRRDQRTGYPENLTRSGDWPCRSFDVFGLTPA